MQINNQVSTFLNKQNTAVIATVNVDGKPNASVIYYRFDDKGSVYFITKTSTQKYRNILTNTNVALCIYDEKARATTELVGRAFEVTEEAEQIEVLDKMAKIRRDDDDVWLPPVADLKSGKLVVMKVEISNVTFNDYKNR